MFSKHPKGSPPEHRTSSKPAIFRKVSVFCRRTCLSEALARGFEKRWLQHELECCKENMLVDEAYTSVVLSNQHARLPFSSTLTKVSLRDTSDLGANSGHGWKVPGRTHGTELLQDHGNATRVLRHHGRY